MIWAREHHCPWCEKTCAYAAAAGNLEVLKWARQHDCPWDAQTIERAANEEVRQWAIVHGCPDAH